MTANDITLSIDIGGTKIAAGVLVGSDLVTQETIPTGAARGGAAVLADVTSLALRMIHSSPRPVQAIGVASAGVIDSETGWVTSATDLIADWGGTPLGPSLAEATGLPVFVTGDVLAHALGEHTLGVGRDYVSVLAVGIGTGIGGAFVDEHGVRSGAGGVAGHVGHVPHKLADGLKCSCGRIGHVEPLASGTGIADAFTRVTGRIQTGREVDDLAEAGDPEALAVVVAAGTALGEAIAGLCNSWDPHAVILSGSVTNSGENWWNAVRAGFADQAMNSIRDTPLLRGRLGGRAPLIGAAIFARTKLLGRESE